MKGSIDWLDVLYHVMAGGALVFLLSLGGAPWQFTALVWNTLFWYIREATQHESKGINPLNWGIGSQMEFYAPTLTGFIIVLIFQLLEK